MVNFSSGNMNQDLKNNKVKRIKTNEQIKFSFYLLQYVVFKNFKNFPNSQIWNSLYL